VERLAAARVVFGDQLVGPAAITVEDGTIVACETLSTTVGLPDRTIVPGFVDLQVNGIDDIDVARARDADWDRLDELLLAQGVTAWCPTLVTAPLDRFDGPLARISEAAAREQSRRPTIVGAHLEGPFLGGAPGAHPVDLIRAPDLDWLAALPPIVTLVTLAPEQPGAIDAIAALRRAGIHVSIGHSTATYEAAGAAAAAGATLATHCFNGMGALHHREPGLIGRALTDDRITACVIADLVHVHPAIVELIFAAKGDDRVVLVTDAVAWRAGAVGPVEIELRDGAPRLPDGTLAGSALTMDGAVRNAVTQCGVELASAVHAASRNPARVLGLHDRGRIEPGCRADLVALTPELTIESVWLGGLHVYGSG
jgi:N-acetylglucosamine-6-phosphate deacetylase